MKHCLICVVTSQGCLVGVVYYVKQFTVLASCACGVSGQCWGGGGWCDCNYGGGVGDGFMVGLALAGFQRSCWGI